MRYLTLIFLIIQLVTSSLLLNILSRDEAENLNVVLKFWEPLIDYWIIGIDTKNTDNSEEIIKRHIGHIPGAIISIDFVDMGTSWTQLVQEGYKRFPQANYGILADADFLPITTNLDKKIFRDTSYSQLMFNVRTDGIARGLNWIYRNGPTVKVVGRVHQHITIDCGNKCKVGNTNLFIQEMQNGYQQRSGEKYHNYVKWLMMDLQDNPGDPITYYYLGDTYFAMGKKELTKDAFRKSKKYYKLCSAACEGKKDFRDFHWRALMALGEILENEDGKISEALDYYERAMTVDPERADSYYYTAKALKENSSDLKVAFHFFEIAAKLPKPNRSSHMNEFSYNCLFKMEMARAAVEYVVSSRWAGVYI